MKRFRSAAIGGLVICLLLGSAVLIQYRFDREGFERLRQGKKLKYYKVDEGVHLLPTPLAVRSLSAGFNSILAEFLMLKSLNYFYQYKYSGRDTEYQNRIYNCVTGLNPFYFNAYRYGGYFLNGPFRMKTHALSSFKRGVAVLTRKDLTLSSWWMQPLKNRKQALVRKEHIPAEQAVKLMLETAVHYFAYLKDNRRGAEICRYGRRVFPKYGGYFLEKEVILRSESGQNRLVAEIWKRFAEENRHNAEKRAMALYMIKKYSSLHSIDVLSERISEYHERAGKYPESLLDIAHPRECIDGFGDVYIYFSTSGELYSRMVESENIEAALALYVRKVKQWYKSEGSYPVTLEDIRINRHEYIHIPFKTEYRYNPETGTVDLPFGFGRDICRCLLELVSAEYIYAAEHETFLNRGEIRKLTEPVPDDDARFSVGVLLNMFPEYAIGFIPEAVPFGLYAASPETGAYIVRESGPVYFKAGIEKVTAWPEDLSSWREAAR